MSKGLVLLPEFAKNHNNYNKTYYPQPEPKRYLGFYCGHWPGQPTHFK